MVNAVKSVRAACSLPVSADTCRADVAEAALDAGASIINDVTGLQYDSHMSTLIGKYKPSLVLCAYGSSAHQGNGLEADTASLLERLVFFGMLQNRRFLQKQAQSRSKGIYWY